MNDWREPGEAPNPDIVRAELPTLLAEILGNVQAAETHAARLRITNIKLTQALAILVGEDATPANSNFISLTVTLPEEEMPRLERAISRVQARNPDFGIDDCCNTLFLFSLGVHGED